MGDCDGEVQYGTEVVLSIWHGGRRGAFDSDLTEGLGQGRVAIHASFEDPSAKAGEVRKRIEFRCLVFWADEPLNV